MSLEPCRFFQRYSSRASVTLDSIFHTLLFSPARINRGICAPLITLLDLNARAVGRREFWSVGGYETRDQTARADTGVVGRRWDQKPGDTRVGGSELRDGAVLIKEGTVGHG